VAVLDREKLLHGRAVPALALEPPEAGEGGAVELDVLLQLRATAVVVDAVVAVDGGAALVHGEGADLAGGRDEDIVGLSELRGAA
jgi:hypothetical protein